MKLRRILSVVALAAMPLTAGCNGDSTGSGQASITGTYTLQTVQGSNLPATVISEPGLTFAVTSGSATLRADRTYSLQLVSLITQGTAVRTDTYNEHGTYVQNNDAVTFTESGAPSGVTGSISGNVLTLNEAGLVLVFRK